MSVSSIKKIIFTLVPVTIFLFSLFVNPGHSSAASCSVESATINPSGEMYEGWYKGPNKNEVIVDIVTKNCEGKMIEVSLTEADTGILNNDDLASSGLDNKSIVVPTSNHIIMRLMAGEEECEIGAGFDCHYFVSIYKLDSGDYKSEGNTNGDLYYECDTICQDNWIIKEISLPKKEDPQPQKEDPKVGKSDTTNYELLAPIPGIDTAIDTQKNDQTNPCPLGKYLNMVIKVFLGICAVLAMIMIVLGGIQYMTSELISSKEAGKESITHAIFGLVLALSAYLILNTINPDLLNVCLNNVTEVTITVEDDFETIDTALLKSSFAPPSSAPTAGCSEGIKTVQTTKGGTFYMCGQTLASNVGKLVEKAWNSSPTIKLSGGSYRSTKEQETIRAKNCGGQQNVYNKNAKCTPLTAYPGRSRHENGLAIDFTCAGKLINLSKSSADTKICFDWLVANAGSYGLKNLPQENWHWSTDGR